MALKMSFIEEWNYVHTIVLNSYLISCVLVSRIRQFNACTGLEYSLEPLLIVFLSLCLPYVYIAKLS